MDAATIGYLSYRWHRICNPYSLVQLERTLAYADLQPGDRAADLGCGNGFTAAWLASRYGLHLSAVERHAPTADLARRNADGVETPGRVEVIEGMSHDYLADAGEHRLITVLGALDILPGLQKPAEVMKALAPSIAPGGWLLWGDPFWKAAPSAELTAVLAADRFTDLSGWVAAGEGAGLVPYHVATSTDAEWEEFIWRMNASLEGWAAENAASPDAPSIRMRAQVLRNLYLREGRQVMGFGLYLFRKPD